jgi:hypothetical protein
MLRVVAQGVFLTAILLVSSVDHSSAERICVKKDPYNHLLSTQSCAETTIHSTIEIDTATYSKQFLRQLEDENKDIRITDNKIISDSRGEVKFPHILKPGIEYAYNARHGDEDYHLVLTRLNISDIAFTFTLEKSGKTIKEAHDTAYFMPYKGIRIMMEFGYATSGLVFQKKTSEGMYSITFAYQTGEYATFGYDNFMRKPGIVDVHPAIRDVPLLVREGTENPYFEYLHAVIMRIQESTYRLQEYINNNSNTDEETVRYKEAWRDFDLLLDEIGRDKTLYDITADTVLLDKAIVYELDSVAGRLKASGIKQREMVPSGQIQEIPVSQFNQFQGSVFQTCSKKVLSARFEKARPTGIVRFNRYSPLIMKYYFSNGHSGPFQFNDFYFAILHGESEAHSIITVWKKNNDNYRLVSILDRLFITSYGGITIDTIVRISKNKTLISGNSMGGDEGEVWGSAWIAIWSYPRELRVVFEDYWGTIPHEENPDSTISENYMYSSCSVVNSKTAILTRKKIWYEHSGVNSIRRDSTIRTARISIDSIMKVSQKERK